MLLMYSKRKQNLKKSGKYVVKRERERDAVRYSIQNAFAKDFDFEKAVKG